MLTEPDTFSIQATLIVLGSLMKTPGTDLAAFDLADGRRREEVD